MRMVAVAPRVRQAQFCKLHSQLTARAWHSALFGFGALSRARVPPVSHDAQKLATAQKRREADLSASKNKSPRLLITPVHIE